MHDSRENFNMDGNFDNGSRNDNQKSGKKQNTTLLVVLLCIFVFIVALVLYIYIFAAKDSPGGSENQFDADTSQTITVSEEDESNTPSVGDTIVVPLVNTSSPSADNTDIKTEVFRTPSLSSSQEDTTALDIATMKSDKALSQGVQFHKHIVQSGESLEDIADLYALKIQTLISINSVTNVNGIQEGDTLSIPDRDGHFYIVQAGDMLSTIANRYSPNLGWETLMELNGLTSDNIKVGQKLFIPDVNSRETIASYSSPTSLFIAPTDGNVTAMYNQYMKNNPNSDSTYLEGIMMSGTTVQASAEGSVADIGYQEDNLGRYIKLTHDGGYETVYGHLDDVTTTIGSQVRAGEVIGSCGTTGGGNLTKPSLYFAIYQNGLPLDPLNFFDL